ncbi:hypothetical protein LAZ67_21001690 [Cordylochernes scorpioides]|uniref:Reverse transcriptase RNase H-like domain-containing protein n=1 Tax=Cordylochernes scorpioides TaxID=51811 RepID=A0ABY6LR57_9ARAC|nr:hypothetical protein LAZ67_21001690 [Cordylochernes scorpioides]
MSRKQRNLEHAMTPNPNTIEIRKFNGQNLDVISWLKFFNKKCQQNHFDEDYKLKNFSNYLDGEAFNFYIEQLQDIDNWRELEQKVLSYFTVKDSNLFSKFLNLKYKDKDDLDIYFKEKSSLAKKLNLDTPLLLEALTDGMPNYLKKYLIAARVKETSDWIKITTQLKYSTNQEKQEPQCKYNSDNQQPSTSNDNRQNFQTRSYYPARSRFNPNSSPSLQPQPPPRSSPRSITAHHQEASSRKINLPPYPCKICSSHQLPNQYHFHRDCPLNKHEKELPTNTHSEPLNPDASSLGVAGVLKQPDEQGILHPIGYFSRKLHPYEQNYTASEIETLAIINSVQRFHTLPTQHTFYLAHRSLTFKMDQKCKKSTRLRCEYNANLKIPWTKYIPKITESYSETVHTTTGFTPKFLYYGIQPQYIEHDTETQTPIEKARKLAIERTIKSHEHGKQLYDIKHPEPIFKEGDQIMPGRRQRRQFQQTDAFTRGMVIGLKVGPYVKSQLTHTWVRSRCIDCGEDGWKKEIREFIGMPGIPNTLYQQENARPHTARISQQALQDVHMLPWPPYSPHLSPIEHTWDIIVRCLHTFPQPRSEDELWQMVEREWRAIPQDAIRSLIGSLPRHVVACIAVVLLATEPTLFSLCIMIIILK